MSGKRRTHQYSIESIKYGFILSIKIKVISLDIICEKKTFSNEAVKSSRMVRHLRKFILTVLKKILNMFEKGKNNLKSP